MATILLIEPDEQLGEDLRQALSIYDHEIAWTREVEEGRALIGQLQPDLVLIDSEAAAETKDELEQACREISGGVGLVLMVDRDLIEEHLTLTRDSGVAVTLIKPVRMSTVVGAVSWTLRGC